MIIWRATAGLFNLVSPISAVLKFAILTSMNQLNFN
jgi:hypothetical protein